MGSKRPNLNRDKLEVEDMKKKKRKKRETKLGTSINHFFLSIEYSGIKLKRGKGRSAKH